MVRLSILMAMLMTTTLFGGMPPSNARMLAAQTESGCPTANGWMYLSTPEEIVPLDGNQTPGLYGPIAVGWTDPPVIYSAGLRRGLRRSNDCGQTWEGVQPGWSGVRGITLDQLGWLQVVNYQGPIGLSQDGGKTWGPIARVYFERDAVGSLAHAFVIAISPKVPGLAYGDIRPYGGRRGPVLARSTDSGATWHVLNDRFPGSLLLVDPVHDLLYVVRGGGSLWQIDLASGDFEAKQFAELPAEIVAQTMSSDGSRHWIATRDGEIYRSLDRGLTWSPITDAPHVGLWRHLAASRTDPGLLFAVAKDGSIWLYREPSVKRAPVQVP